MKQNTDMEANLNSWKLRRIKMLLV